MTQIFGVLVVMAGTGFGMKRKAPEGDAPLRNVRPKYWSAPTQSKFIYTLVVGQEKGVFERSAESLTPLMVLVTSVLDEGIYSKDHTEKLIPVLQTALKSQMSEDMRSDLLKAIARYIYGAPETASPEDFADFLSFVDPFLKNEKWTKPIPPARRKHPNLIGEIFERAPAHIRNSKYTLSGMKSLCCFINTIRQCLAIHFCPEVLLDTHEALRFYIANRPCVKENILAILNESDREFVEKRILEAYKEEFGHFGNKELLLAMRSENSEKVRDIFRYGSADVSANNQQLVDVFFYETFLSSDILELMLENPMVNPSHDKNAYFKQCAKRSDLDCCKVLLKDRRFDPTLDDASILVSAAENGQISVLRLLLEDGRLSDFIKQAKASANKAKKTDALLFLTFFGQDQALNETIKKVCGSASEASIRNLLNIPGANHSVAFNALVEANRIDILKSYISMPSFNLSFDCCIPDILLPVLDLIDSIRKYDAKGLVACLEKELKLEWIEWALIATIRHLDDKMLALVIQYIAYIKEDISAYKYLSEVNQLINAVAPSTISISAEQMKKIIKIIRLQYNL